MVLVFITETEAVLQEPIASWIQARSPIVLAIVMLPITVPRTLVRSSFLGFLLEIIAEIVERCASHEVQARTDGTITFFPSLPVSHHSVLFANRSDWLRTTIRSTNRVTTMRQRRQLNAKAPARRSSAKTQRWHLSQTDRGARAQSDKSNITKPAKC